jgi:hypothetical protein
LGSGLRWHFHKLEITSQSLQNLSIPTTDRAPASSSRPIDLAQLQREADDLARTAQTISTEVASVRKGMLPKDVNSKN